jgi:hypothetical protein
MSSHSNTETQEAVPSAPVTSAITPAAEVDTEALSLLREFFVLLNEWDQQGGRS